MKSLASERDRRELLHRLDAVRPDSAARWGTMSAPQMVCHLADAFRMALGERAVTVTNRLLLRTAVKWTALYAPLRWPTGIATTPELDQCSTGTRPSDFARDRSEVASLMERMARCPNTYPWPPHPLFGPMSDRAWRRWAYLHTDHHLRQFGA